MRDEEGAKPVSFEALLPFALLLIPGALTQYFYERLRPGAPISSDFERVFRSFLVGWPVLIADWFLVKWIFGLKPDFGEVTAHFGNVWFMVVYFGATGVLSFATAGGLVKLRSPAGEFFNSVAKKLGQTVVLRDSVWDIMFRANGIQAVAVTSPDGHTRKGFVHYASPWSGESGAKDLILVDEDIFEQHAECFTEIVRTYIDANSGTVICEYSMEAYRTKVENAMKENAA